jgi:hypothetical protein
MCKADRDAESGSGIETRHRLREHQSRYFRIGNPYIQIKKFLLYIGSSFSTSAFQKNNNDGQGKFQYSKNTLNDGSVSASKHHRNGRKEIMIMSE